MPNSLSRPIVVGVDGSEDGKRAVAWGAWEAARRGIGVRLIHVHRPIHNFDLSMVLLGRWEHGWARGLLAGARRQITIRYPDVVVEIADMSGSPAAVLIDESVTASLVVVGSRAASGVAGHLVASEAGQVTAHACCPVIVVRSTCADPADARGRPIVVGLDGSIGSHHALAFAVEEAVYRHVDLHAVHVWEFPRVHGTGPVLIGSHNSADDEVKALRLLAEATEHWRDRYPELTIVHRPVRDLDPVDALARASRDADLLVVGSHSNGGFLGLRLGSTIDGLIRRSPAGLAVIRSESPDPR